MQHVTGPDTLYLQNVSPSIRPYNGPTNGQVAGAISALRFKVGGGKDVNISTQAYDKTENYVPPTSIVPGDSNALAFARSVAEVSAIVFLGGSGKVRDQPVWTALRLYSFCVEGCSDVITPHH